VIQENRLVNTAQVFCDQQRIQAGTIQNRQRNKYSDTIDDVNMKEVEQSVVIQKTIE